MQSIMTSPQLQPVTIQHQRVLTPTGQTIQTLSTAPTTVHTMQQQVQQVQQVPVSNSSVVTNRKYVFLFHSGLEFVSLQVLVQQPQILKTDSLVLTTLKPDGTQVLSTMQNPAGITTLTTPIQNTALQVPVHLAQTSWVKCRCCPWKFRLNAWFLSSDFDGKQHSDHRPGYDGRRRQAANQTATGSLPQRSRRSQTEHGTEPRDGRRHGDWSGG